MFQVIPEAGPVFRTILVDGPEEFYYMLVETPEGVLLYVNRLHVEQD